MLFRHCLVNTKVWSCILHSAYCILRPCAGWKSEPAAMVRNKVAKYCYCGKDRYRLPFLHKHNNDDRPSAGQVTAGRGGLRAQISSPHRALLCDTCNITMQTGDNSVEWESPSFTLYTPQHLLNQTPFRL